MPDTQCAGLGIPEHLHRCCRPVIPDFEESETLYRRRCFADKELIYSIAFNAKNSSSNRSLFSNPEDVRWNDSGQFVSCDVLYFPAKFFAGRSWNANDRNDRRVFTVEVEHKPLRCNYAHTDFKIFDDHNIQNVVADLPKGIKAKIRHELKPLVELTAP